jgi:hypothetical protein
MARTWPSLRGIGSALGVFVRVVVDTKAFVRAALMESLWPDMGSRLDKSGGLWLKPHNRLYVKASRRRISWRANGTKSCINTYTCSRCGKVAEGCPASFRAIRRTDWIAVKLASMPSTAR